MSVPVPSTMSWPLGAIDEGGALPYARDDKSVREVILNILLTRPGERLMRPEFGAGLLDFVHQPNNQTTRHLLADVVHKAIERWETRIELEGVDVLADADDLATVHVNIRYRMRHRLQPAELSLSLRLGG